MNWGYFWPGFIFGLLLSFSGGLIWLQRRRRGRNARLLVLCLICFLSAFGLVQLLWIYFGGSA